MFDAIFYDGPGNGKYPRTFRVDPIACEGCSVCAWFCPEHAIEFKPAVNGQWFISETRRGPMVHAKLGIAEENSGKLVSLVRNAAKEGQEKIFKNHKKYWDNFWSKSFVDLSQDYLNNLWYLQLYQLGSSSLGKYPPHFINSLWSWTRDARPWNHYYHWNQQHYAWPLLSSGHPELLEPYARWRLES